MQKFCHTLRNESISQALKIICISHDLGKGTPYFQDYINKKNIPENSFLKSHSTVSSLYTYKTCKDILMDDFLTFITSIVVQGHHGIIPSPQKAIHRIYQHKEELNEQFKSISSYSISELNSLLTSQSYPLLNQTSILSSEDQIIEEHLENIGSINEKY